MRDVSKFFAQGVPRSRHASNCIAPGRMVMVERSPCGAGIADPEALIGDDVSDVRDAAQCVSE